MSPPDGGRPDGGLDGGLDGWRELRALRRDHRLQADYPRVCTLAASVPVTERDRIGHWLARLDPAEVHRSHPSSALVRIAVTGSGTLGTLAAPLRGAAAACGLVADVLVTGHAQFRQELLDPASATHAFRPDLTVCLLDAGAVTAELPCPWSVDDATAALDRLATTVRRAARPPGAGRTGPLVLNTVPLPRDVLHQLVDHTSRARLSAAWHRFNADLLDLADDPQVTCLDLAALADEEAMAPDPAAALYAGQHLPERVLARYAGEVAHLARASSRPKKVLALDLDGTLWPGVLAESGPADLDLADDPASAAFAAVRRLARQLAAQGVLVTVCSKNDPDDVAAVFRDRTDLTLRENDLVAVAAGWGPKPDALTDLAGRLDLALDSVVFVDDSPFECGFVRDRLPGVAVVQADGEPAGRVRALLADGWLTTRTLTDADRHRTRDYRSAVERRSYLDRTDSLEEYLHGLDLVVRIEPARDQDVARLAQLTHRTNQFNLTTERWDAAEVAARVGDDTTPVLTVRAADRFGDHGLVGAVFGRLAPAAGARRLEIENMLLSCRVLGRGIESAVLATVLATARSLGATEAVGHYRPTARNAAVADLYPRHGFRTDASAVHPTDGSVFRHGLQELPAVPAHLRVEAGPVTPRPAPVP